jgi:uncharacterized protein
VTGALPRRLARNARWVWALEQALFWSVALVAVMIAASQLDLPGAVRLIPLAGLVIGVAVVPIVRWRRWSWDVRPDRIEIRRGVVTVRHTVVPMLRVQHVDTTSNVFEQWFGLATVAVHTAAGSHRIPLLTARDAEEVRARIAVLAEAVDEP